MKDALIGTTPDTAVKVIDGASARDRIERLSSSIARRAYEIFDGDGRTPGRALDHWFRAEAELLHPLHLAVNETDDAVTVRAEVPGYRPDELEVSVESTRLTITGTREAREQYEAGKIVYTEHCANRILRSVELPADVDISKSIANLKDGVLEVSMPRVTGALKARSATQSA